MIFEKNLHDQSYFVSLKNRNGVAPKKFLYHRSLNQEKVNLNYNFDNIFAAGLYTANFFGPRFRMLIKNDAGNVIIK